MISFSNDPTPNEFGRSQRDHREREHREPAGEPRAVGQLMAAVLARYGIAANVDAARPRLPQVEHQPTGIGGFVSVG